MKRRQAGIAVILAMAVVALAAAAATAILASQSAWARRTELTARHAQARMVVGAGIDWARAVLFEDRRVSTVDHAGEAWAARLPPQAVEDGVEKGEIAGAIEDQQGLFNLNNLAAGGRVQPAQLEAFRRLLAILDLPLELADALADWVDADSEEISRAGAEDAYYLAQSTPYRAANQPLVDEGELALVRGYDDAIRARLRPFVTALPRTTPLNVNTASPEVLASIVPGLTLDQARALVAARDRSHFGNVGEFQRRVPPGLEVPAAAIGVGSDYFIARVRARIGEGEARGAALLEREEGRWPRVLWRKSS